MKKYLLALAMTIISTQAFAASITADCKSKYDPDGMLWDVTHMTLHATSTKVTLTSTTHAENVLAGKFSRIGKNGKYVYDSPDVGALADQTMDKGSILVDESVMNGESGDVMISTYQEGDSSGGSWLTQVFKCETL